MSLNYAVSDNLAQVYDEALRSGGLLSAFPLYIGNRNDYNDLMLSSGVSMTFMDRKRVDALYQEARTVYPMLGDPAKDGVGGIHAYYAMKYSKPVMTRHSASTGELDLLFPVPESDKYLLCRMRDKDVAKAIEDAIVTADRQHEVFLGKPDYCFAGLKADMARDQRLHLRAMRCNFERFTGLRIYDPLRAEYSALYAPEYNESVSKFDAVQDLVESFLINQDAVEMTDAYKKRNITNEVAMLGKLRWHKNRLANN